jgi:cytochrome c-type biogenesis protein CcmE
MRRRDRRLLLIALSGVVLVAATAVASTALRDTASFFYSPTDAHAKKPPAGTSARIGGLVATGTVVRGEGGTVDFVVTDGAADLSVRYRGVLPDLFREGQGVVAEGRFTDARTFEAKTILARHDENYMPKEVADSLKASGQWKQAPAAGTPEPRPYADQGPPAGGPQAR